jgi:hypothetical protein
MKLMMQPDLPAQLGARPLYIDMIGSSMHVVACTEVVAIRIIGWITLTDGSEKALING